MAVRDSSLEKALDRAAEAVVYATSLLIGAGAGMGVDSGLPDFRGAEGFWRAYPAFKGRRFSEMSNPRWFASDPELAWGFFGHRFNLYRSATPHNGFAILQQLAQSKPTAIYTSNVDGHFERSGLGRFPIVECHGSIHYLQCAEQCCDKIWPAGELNLDVSSEIRLLSDLPRCSFCGAVARPNILMFGDYAWLSERTDGQLTVYQEWKRNQEGSELVVIEIGAGTAIPAVRMECEYAGGTLIRINPRDYDVKSNQIAIPLGGLTHCPRSKLAYCVWNRRPRQVVAKHWSSAKRSNPTIRPSRASTSHLITS